jgi:uncharacterized membrane protein
LKLRRREINRWILPIYIYFLTAIGLTPVGSSTVHIYTQTVHRLTPGGSSTVQYTFTHKQYTEYTERNIHNNKKNLYHITVTILAITNDTFSSLVSV